MQVVTLHRVQLLFVILMALVTSNIPVPITPSNSDKLHCSSGALTGPHGLLVQASLAIVAFGALVG